MKKNKALFLDRDGVICKALPRGEYLISLEQFEFMDGIKDFIDFTKQNGYKIFVITNQGQIAKKLITISELDAIHKKMQEFLDNKINAIYYCPHQDGDGCGCRKPNPGLPLEAIKEFNINPSLSFFIGDSDKDINTGVAIGSRTIFIKNDFNTHELDKCSPDFVVNSLEEIKCII